MPHATSIKIRHEVLALACEGMWQSTIAGRMGLTHATINRIFRRHAATGKLMPGKATRAPWKTTPRQDHALFRMVQPDRSGRGGVDEEFVWNEGWLENHQQLAIIPQSPCL